MFGRERFWDGAAGVGAAGYRILPEMIELLDVILEVHPHSNDTDAGKERQPPTPGE